MGYRESKTIFAIATRASKMTDSMKSEDIDGGSPASFDDRERGMSYDDALVCPPHTTERKLVSKIDFHVVPFLCILYLLAFLDR